MKKVFKLEDLDCAVCANKIEEGVGKLPLVKSVSVNYIMQNLTIEIEDENFDDVMKKVCKLIRKIEPDCTLIR